MVSTVVAAARTGMVWPPDDTEESVVGTNRHQMTIMNLRLGINEIARASAEAGRPVAWQALSQTMLTGFSRPDGSRLVTLPDIFVYRRPIGPDRGSVSVLLEGPPALIVEVASESTYEKDVDLGAGKGWSYERAAVPEYLSIDPLGEYLSAPGRGWRLLAGRYQPWEPDEAGIWWSEQVPLGIAAADGLITVYDRNRRPQLREGEIAAALNEKDAEIAALRRQLAELQGE